MMGYDLSRTLSGYGLATETVMGEDLDELYVILARAFSDQLPHAVVIKRKMAPGIEGAEGSPHAHEVLKPEVAIKYLEARGHSAAADQLKTAKHHHPPWRSARPEAEASRASLSTHSTSSTIDVLSKMH